MLISVALLSCSAFGKVYEFTSGNQLTLLENARESVALKLEMVKKARHHVHIMTYYWDNNGYPIELMQELNKAHARGVEIRIMTTYLPSLTMDLLGKAKHTLTKNKKSSNATLAFLKMTPAGPLSVTNNIHEKIFLVDSEAAILGGRNISDNDFRAKDLEILLKGPVVNQVQKHFESMFSFLVDEKIIQHCSEFETNCNARYNNLKFSEKKPGFYPLQPRYQDNIKARILTNEILFQQRDQKLWGEQRFLAKDDIIDTIVSTDFNHLRAYNYFILPTERYRNYLEKKAELGKKIEIITNGQETAASISDKGYLYGLPAMLNFLLKGLDIYEWQGAPPLNKNEDHLHYLHEKVMLFDDDHAFIGSHNFGSGSTSVSSEIAVEFFSPQIVGRLKNVFDEEISNERKTQKINAEEVSKTIEANKIHIKLLHMFYVRNIIRELY